MNGIKNVQLVQKKAGNKGKRNKKQMRQIANWEEDRFKSNQIHHYTKFRCPKHFD